MIRDKKVADLNKINSELKKYSSASQKLASKLKALKNPVSLCAGDFNCEKSLSKLSQSTLRVCEDAHKLSQKIISMSNITDQEESFYEQLKLATSALKAENEALKSFLAKAYPFVH